MKLRVTIHGIGVWLNRGFGCLWCVLSLVKSNGASGLPNHRNCDQYECWLNTIWRAFVLTWKSKIVLKIKGIFIIYRVVRPSSLHLVFGLGRAPYQWGLLQHLVSNACLIGSYSARELQSLNPIGDVVVSRRYMSRLVEFNSINHNVFSPWQVRIADHIKATLWAWDEHPRSVERLDTKSSNSWTSLPDKNIVVMVLSNGMEFASHQWWCHRVGCPL